MNYLSMEEARLIKAYRLPMRLSALFHSAANYQWARKRQSELSAKIDETERLCEYVKTIDSSHTMDLSVIASNQLNRLTNDLANVSIDVSKHAGEFADRAGDALPVLADAMEAADFSLSSQRMKGALIEYANANDLSDRECAD